MNYIKNINSLIEIKDSLIEKLRDEIGEHIVEVFTDSKPNDKYSLRIDIDSRTALKVNLMVGTSDTTDKIRIYEDSSGLKIELRNIQSSNNKKLSLLQAIILESIDSKYMQP